PCCRRAIEISRTLASIPVYRAPDAATYGARTPCPAPMSRTSSRGCGSRSSRRAGIARAWWYRLPEWPTQPSYQEATCSQLAPAALGARERRAFPDTEEEPWHGVHLFAVRSAF